MFYTPNRYNQLNNFEKNPVNISEKRYKTFSLTIPN